MKWLRGIAVKGTYGRKERKSQVIRNGVGTQCLLAFIFLLICDCLLRTRRLNRAKTLRAMKSWTEYKKSYFDFVSSVESNQLECYSLTNKSESLFGQVNIEVTQGRSKHSVEWTLFSRTTYNEANTHKRLFTTISRTVLQFLLYYVNIRFTKLKTTLVFTELPVNRSHCLHSFHKYKQCCGRTVLSSNRFGYDLCLDYKKCASVFTSPRNVKMHALFWQASISSLWTSSWTQITVIYLKLANTRFYGG